MNQFGFLPKNAFVMQKSIPVEEGILFYIENCDDQDRDLLQKIIQAMKLDLADVEICGPGVPEFRRLVVVFGSSPNLPTLPTAVDVVRVHHPKEMISNPALKKDTWVKIQGVLQKMKV